VKGLDLLTESMYISLKYHVMKMIKILILALLITSCMPQGSAGPEQGSVLSADKTEINYTLYGAGETALVFVHCWCCDQGYWREQVDTFSREYKVVTIDLAGHGKSGKERDDYTLQAFGMDVARVVKHLELDRIILIGHSMGGGVILAAAHLLKEQTMAVIGVDTYQGFQYELSDSMITQFVQPFRQDFYNTTIGFVHTMFPPGADSVLVMEIAKDMAEGPQETGISAMINNISTDPVELLKGLDIPIYSINSRMFPIDVEANRKLYPDFEVRFIEGVGHFIQLENPRAFNRELNSILQDINS
jgi:pimeloyl-ACP methyl ester carboxylesterase